MRRFLLALGMALLFLASCTASTIALQKFAGAVRNEVTEVSYDFPVLVLAGADSETLKTTIVRYRNLSLVQEQFPGYSLLVPDGSLDLVNQRLGSLRLVLPDGDTPFQTGQGSVKIESGPTGVQNLVVQDNRLSNWENVGWYDVSGQTITPRFHRYFSREKSNVAMLMTSFLFNLVLWSLAWLIIKLVRSRR
jgi:hypothetical protein